MPDEKLYTARDLILAKREAFHRGAETVFDHFRIEPDDMRWRGTIELAAEAYPFPKRKLPRVLMRKYGLTHYRWRLTDGVLERASLSSADWSLFLITSDGDWRRVGPIYADLLAHPTEEVDDDA